MNLKREAGSMLRYIARLFVRKIFNRFFSALVGCLLVVNLTLDSYAAVPVATGSDWMMDGGDLSGSGLVHNFSFDDVRLTMDDLLGGLSESELIAYYNTFRDYPTSVAYPSEIMQPRFAISLSVAAIVIFRILLAAVGVAVTLWTVENIKDFMELYETRLRLNGRPELLETWQQICNARFGQAISGMKELYKDFKDFTRENINGYGTNSSQTVTIPSSGASGVPGITVDGTYFKEIGLSFTVSNVVSPIFSYFFYDSNHSFGIFHVSKSNFKTYYVTNLVGEYYYNGTNSSGESTLIKALQDSSLICIEVPNYFKFNFLGYFTSPDFVLGGSASVSISVPNTWIDLQDEKYANVADTLTIPATPELADTLIDQIAGAATGAAVTGTLTDTGTWTIDNTATDEEEHAYPWLPGITGVLTGISDALTGIKDWITTIPETLVNLKDAIIAIPGQIADFFTIDTVVIAGAFAGLQEAFASRFSGITQLASVFNRNYAFSTVYPVIKMAIPADPPMLRQMFGGKSEIVFLDLNPFADNFIYVRTLLIAFLYVSFAFWFLDEFDVKIHIG